MFSDFLKTRQDLAKATYMAFQLNLQQSSTRLIGGLGATQTPKSVGSRLEPTKRPRSLSRKEQQRVLHELRSENAQLRKELEGYKQARDARRFSSWELPPKRTEDAWSLLAFSFCLQ